MNVEQLNHDTHTVVVQDSERASSEPTVTADKGQRAEWVMGFALAFSAVRCILQYVVLPFVLPVLGVAGDFPPQVFLVVNVIAMAAIIASVRRLWRINYKYKWQYLVIGITALIIQGAFAIHDLTLSGIL